MKITNVRSEQTFYVDTDEGEFPYYRCNQTGQHWENLMGDSWEPIADDEEIKALFIAYCQDTWGWHG